MQEKTPDVVFSQEYVVVLFYYFYKIKRKWKPSMYKNQKSSEIESVFEKIIPRVAVSN